ncbi:peptidase inhibitor family I36 protein [Embleya hyalina]|uniref:Peptidase inhibitor family I36 n=1 Tax=Embleya hyalina TaxID=516124 RepID=A0A401Z0A5_9ACTN|nr:peptidase inhibitor family I36 protein [Embleya hyalina]GCE00330.1 hypothetical protein EHYA_08055 [Embleya hyalina]
MRIATRRVTGAGLVALALLLGMSLAPGTASARGGYDRCTSGYSCYFSDTEGGGDLWYAPGPGCWNLGTWNPPFNDRISSVWNRGGGVVHMYNWVGHWLWIDDVQVGQQWNVYGGDRRNDVIDMVCIGSTP